MKKAVWQKHHTLYLEKDGEEKKLEEIYSKLAQTYRAKT